MRAYEAHVFERTPPMPDIQPTQALDVQRARQLMVDGQLRPNKVTDRRIIDAMRSLPRENFLPAERAAFAYIDESVPLGHGRCLTKPLTLARLLQLARPRAGERALVVGSASGYAAVVLAICGLEVTALEQVPDLIALARRAFQTVGAMEGGGTIDFVEGRLTDGYAEAAPYDLVFIDGAVRDIPPVIGRQVAATGRLVTVVCRDHGVGVAVLAEPSTGGLRAQPAFDATAPLLPELLPAAGFSF
jgi:protein-L-isoaspartate(D-aspartate) O-methyltransferase